MNGKKKITVLGGGFGGLTLALKLEKILKRGDSHEIILVDKNPYHLYTPELYEIAALPREIADAGMLKTVITIPFQDILAGRKIKFVQGELTGINKEERRILLKDGGSLPYNYLVLALGSETNFFNIPGLEENSYTLKTFNDAIRLRNRAEELVKTKNRLSIVIGGGGSTGVELAAEFTNFICTLKEKVTHGSTCDVRIILVEGAQEILPGFHPWLVGRARRRLQNLGVDIKTSSVIKGVRKEQIITVSENISYDLLVWTGGVRANRILEKLGLTLNKKGQVVVNEFLEAYPGIFAIGDNAEFKTSSTIPVPWNVPVAESEARRLAKNIAKEIRGRAKSPFRPWPHYPYVLTVGKKYAIADLVFIKFSGITGWLAKLLVELKYLLFILPPVKALKVWMSSIRVYSSND